ncbi:MAG: hypothetical protein IKK55_02450 [Clostridia bacterium]|nr:hypothetical protein [Clostridia bacterium]MBR6741174.1 hypothetical protein [Clostridia bacterium]
MDDLNQKLAQILNDPESMNRVREMAESILSKEEKKEEKTDDSVFGIPDSNELMNIMSIVSRLNAKNDDARTNLLSALKPHLSEPKREKVDTAIKILRLLELLPVLKESGVLGKLL